MLVIDVSGSMGEFADPSDSSAGTRLDLAKAAAIGAVDLFAPDDEIGLRVFTTDVNQTGDVEDTFLDLVPYGRLADNREEMRRRIGSLVPLNGTPLYDVTADSYQTAVDSFDPTRINAVILLTDGVNDDGDQSDDEQQLDDLLDQLRSGGGPGGAPGARLHDRVLGRRRRQRSASDRRGQHGGQPRVDRSHVDRPGPDRGRVQLLASGSVASRRWRGARSATGSSRLRSPGH